MTISDLVSQLNVLRDEHGDIDIFVNGYEIINVEYNGEDDTVDIVG